jgi:prophage maintenance system killer protein
MAANVYMDTHYNSTNPTKEVLPFLPFLPFPPEFLHILTRQRSLSPLRTSKTQVSERTFEVLQAVAADSGNQRLRVFGVEELVGDACDLAASTVEAILESSDGVVKDVAYGVGVLTAAHKGFERVLEIREGVVAQSGNQRVRVVGVDELVGDAFDLAAGTLEAILESSNGVVKDVADRVGVLTATHEGIERILEVREGVVAQSRNQRIRVVGVDELVGDAFDLAAGTLEAILESSNGVVKDVADRVGVLTTCNGCSKSGGAERKGDERKLHDDSS